MTGTPGCRPDRLAGVRIVEISSFVAVPLAGMTLAQLGAEVIRVDPVGGAADYHRWPVTDDGDSIYWAGLNKGKRSVAADVRSPDGQDLVQRLIADSGVLITNVAGRQWHSYDTLARLRPDLIHVEVSGRADGGTGVDYTVNAGIGFPLVTGPAGLAGPVNHVLPAWDVACGIYAALAVVTALRHRDATGQGQRISIPLENVALATAGNLSFLTEVMVNGTPRERIGNSIYGQYGQEFTSSDGVSFMIVALTRRHFRDLTELTETTKAVAALARNTRRRLHRRGRPVSTPRRADRAVRRVVHRSAPATEVTAALSATSVLWERYRTFAEVVTDDRVTANPMFTRLDQPRIGEYLAPGLADVRSTATTRLPSPHPRSATTPPPCCRNGWGSARPTSTQLDDSGHRCDERAARHCSTLRAVPRTTRGSVRPAGRRASGRSAASSSRRAWPPRAGPSTATAADQHASAVPARRRGRRPRRVRRHAGVRRPDRRRAARRVPAGRTPADHRDGVVRRDLPGPEHGSAVAGMPAIPTSLPRTGPAGPRRRCRWTKSTSGSTTRARRRVRPAVLVAGDGSAARRSAAAHAGRGLRHRRVHDRPRAAGARPLDEGPHPPQRHDRLVDLVPPAGARRTSGICWSRGHPPRRAAAGW